MSPLCFLHDLTNSCIADLNNGLHATHLPNLRWTTSHLMVKPTTKPKVLFMHNKTSSHFAQFVIQVFIISSTSSPIFPILSTQIGNVSSLQLINFPSKRSFAFMLQVAWHTVTTTKYLKVFQRVLMSNSYRKLPTSKQTLKVSTSH